MKFRKAMALLLVFAIIIASGITIPSEYAPVASAYAEDYDYEITGVIVDSEDAATGEVEFAVYTGADADELMLFDSNYNQLGYWDAASTAAAYGDGYVWSISATLEAAVEQELYIYPYSYDANAYGMVAAVNVFEGVTAEETVYYGYDVLGVAATGENAETGEITFTVYTGVDADRLYMYNADFSTAYTYMDAGSASVISEGRRVWTFTYTFSDTSGRQVGFHAFNEADNAFGASQLIGIFGWYDDIYIPDFDVKSVSVVSEDSATGEVEFSVETGIDVDQLEFYPNEDSYYYSLYADEDSTVSGDVRIWNFIYTFDNCAERSVTFAGINYEYEDYGEDITLTVFTGSDVELDYEIYDLVIESQDAETGDVSLTITTGIDADIIYLGSAWLDYIYYWNAEDDSYVSGDVRIWELQCGFEDASAMEVYFYTYCYDRDDNSAKQYAWFFGEAPEILDYNVHDVVINSQDAETGEASFTVTTGVDAEDLDLYANEPEGIPSWNADEYSTVSGNVRIWEVSYTFENLNPRSAVFFGYNYDDGCYGSGMAVDLFRDPEDESSADIMIRDVSLVSLDDAEATFQVMTGLDVEALEVIDVNTNDTFAMLSADDDSYFDAGSRVWDITCDFGDTDTARLLVFRTIVYDADGCEYESSDYKYLLTFGIENGYDIEAVYYNSEGFYLDDEGWTCLDLNIETGIEAKYLYITMPDGDVLTFEFCSNDVYTSVYDNCCDWYPYFECYFGEPGEYTLSVCASPDGVTMGQSAEFTITALDAGENYPIYDIDWNEDEEEAGLYHFECVTGPKAMYISVQNAMGDEVAFMNAEDHASVEDDYAYWRFAVDLSDMIPCTLVFYPMPTDSHYGVGVSIEITEDDVEYGCDIEYLLCEGEYNAEDEVFDAVFYVVTGIGADYINIRYDNESYGFSSGDCSWINSESGNRVWEIYCPVYGTGSKIVTIIAQDVDNDTYSDPREIIVECGDSEIVEVEIFGAYMPYWFYLDENGESGNVTITFEAWTSAEAEYLYLEDIGDETYSWHYSDVTSYIEDDMRYWDVSFEITDCRIDWYYPEITASADGVYMSEPWYIDEIHISEPRCNVEISDVSWYADEDDPLLFHFEVVTGPMADGLSIHDETYDIVSEYYEADEYAVVTDECVTWSFSVQLDYAEPVQLILEPINNNFEENGIFGGRDYVVELVFGSDYGCDVTWANVVYDSFYDDEDDDYDRFEMSFRVNTGIDARQLIAEIDGREYILDYEENSTISGGERYWEFDKFVYGSGSHTAAFTGYDIYKDETGYEVSLSFETSAEEYGEYGYDVCDLEILEEIYLDSESDAYLNFSYIVTGLETEYLIFVGPEGEESEWYANRENSYVVGNQRYWDIGIWLIGYEAGEYSATFYGENEDGDRSAPYEFWFEILAEEENFNVKEFYWYFDEYDEQLINFYIVTGPYADYLSICDYDGNELAVIDSSVITPEYYYDCTVWEFTYELDTADSCTLYVYPVKTEEYDVYFGRAAKADIVFGQNLGCEVLDVEWNCYDYESEYDTYYVDFFVTTELDAHELWVACDGEEYIFNMYDDAWIQDGCMVYAFGLGVGSGEQTIVFTGYDSNADGVGDDYPLTFTPEYDPDFEIYSVDCNEIQYLDTNGDLYIEFTLKTGIDTEYIKFYAPDGETHIWSKDDLEVFYIEDEDVLSWTTGLFLSGIETGSYDCYFAASENGTTTCWPWEITIYVCDAEDNYPINSVEWYYNDAETGDVHFIVYTGMASDYLTVQDHFGNIDLTFAAEDYVMGSDVELIWEFDVELGTSEACTLYFYSGNYGVDGEYDKRVDIIPVYDDSCDIISVEAVSVDEAEGDGYCVVFMVYTDLGADNLYIDAGGWEYYFSAYTDSYITNGERVWECPVWIGESGDYIAEFIASNTETENFSESVHLSFSTDTAQYNVTYVGGEMWEEGYIAKGKAVDIVVYTDADAQYLSMYSETGAHVKTWYADAYATDVESEYGARKWEISYSFGGTGIRTMTFKGTPDKVDYSEGYAASILVTSGSSNFINSVAFVEEVVPKGTPAEITVKTGADALFLKMYAENGSLIKTWKAADCSEIVGTQRVWNISYTFSGVGSRTMTFKGSIDNSTMSAGKSTTVLITSGSSYAVTSAAFAKEYVVKGTSVTATVKTGGDARFLRMYSETGAPVKTWNAADYSRIEGTDRVWTVNVSIGTPGNRSLTFKASMDGSDNSYGTGKTAGLLVTSGSDIAVTSAAFDKTYVKKGVAVNATVKTGADAQYLRMYSESGSTVKTWNAADYSEINDGFRVWTVSISIGTPGNRQLTFKASKDGSTYGAGQTAALLVTSGTDIAVTSAVFAQVSVEKGTAVNATVKTGIDAKYLSMYSESGAFVKSWTAASFSTVSGTTRIWTVPVTIGTPGNRQLTFKASADGSTYGAAQTAALTVTSGTNIDVVSAEFAQASVVKGTPVTATIKTGADAQHLTMYAEGGTKVKTWAAANYSTVSGTTRIWTVSVSIGTPGDRQLTFKASADGSTYGAGKTAALKVTNALDYSVTSAAFNKEYAAKGTSVTATVKTGADAQHLTMYSEGGAKVKTWAAADYSTVSGTTRTWTVTVSIGTPGARQLTFKASADGSTYGTGKTANLLVTSGSDYGVTSAAFNQTTAPKGTTVSATVKTGADAQYLTMYSEGGAKVKTWYASSSSTISGTTRVWNVSLSIGTAGDRSLTFKASKDGSTYGTGKTADIQITAE